MSLNTRLLETRPAPGWAVGAREDVGRDLDARVTCGRALDAAACTAIEPTTAISVRSTPPTEAPSRDALRTRGPMGEEPSLGGEHQDEDHPSPSSNVVSGSGTTQASVGPVETASALAQINGLLDRMDHSSRAAIEPTERLALIDAARLAERRIEALLVTLIAEADAVEASMQARGTPTTSWLALDAATSGRTAAGLVFAGTEVVAHAPVKDAALAGHLGVKQARAVADALTNLPASLDPGLRSQITDRLVERAQRARAEQIPQLADQVLAELAPPAVIADTTEALLQRLDEQARRAHARRGFTFFPPIQGSVKFHGSLPTLDAARFIKLIDAHMQADRREGRDRARDRRDPRARSRTPEQRRADALLSLIASRAAPSSDASTESRQPTAGTTAGADRGVPSRAASAELRLCGDAQIPQHQVPTTDTGTQAGTTNAVDDPRDALLPNAVDDPRDALIPNAVDDPRDGLLRTAARAAPEAGPTDCGTRRAQAERIDRSASTGCAELQPTQGDSTIRHARPHANELKSGNVLGEPRLDPAASRAPRERDRLAHPSCVAAQDVPTSHAPASHVPASHVPTSHVPASHVPASHVPVSHVPAPRVAGDRPRVVVVMQEADLRARAEQAGVLTNGQRISAGDLRRLCCDADLTPVVLGGDSEILDVGRTQRLVTPGIRQALSLRDGGCCFPGCAAPDEQCEAHHETPWHAGGRTSLMTTALLCPHHHAMVEPPRLHSTGPPRDRWQLRMKNGLPEFVPPARVDPTRLPIPGQRRGAIIRRN